MTTVISIENLSKTYRLGQIGTGTFTHDLAVWWAKVRGKPNPLLKIGEADHGNRDGEELWALKDVSFTVEQGEVLGIIGRNGAGKSTLLKILSRVTAPTSGKIKVKGRIASLLEVGTGFHPELTGRENIFLNGAILGMKRSEIDRKFDEIVDFSGVEKFIDTPVKRYSSGMYVRLAFAVAAHLEPEILVVDEVLAVGDAEFQKKCLGKMGDVAKEGRTVLFVSHNMAAVKSLCHSGILIQEGKLKLLGDIENVVDQYTSPSMELTGTWFAEEPDKVVNDRVGRIISVKTLDKNGIPAIRWGLADPIIIEIKYRALKQGAILNLSIHIHNSHDVLVFASPSLNDEGWGGNSHDMGLYTGMVAIPGGLLNQDQYKISIVLVMNRSQVVEHYEQIVSFETVDFGENRHGYYGNWGGVVRPQLNWMITKETDTKDQIKL